MVNVKPKEDEQQYQEFKAYKSNDHNRKKSKCKPNDKIKNKSIRFTLKKGRKTQFKLENQKAETVKLSKFAPKETIAQSNMSEIQDKILKYVNMSKSTKSSKDWRSLENSKKEESK